MSTHKHPRTRGKISLTQYFQQFKSGDSVAVVQELSVPFPYLKRLQGRTGKVIDKRGSSYYVEISDLGKPKKYIIHPVHLRRIQY